ncbi:MAG: crossover junction endodeoxyribonuclease RuvC [Hyphomonadaceae bacterium]|nr:crossover junction endodeoxyribonuclease RuvC [Hyphomonadaceae bacterium]MBC6413299.1 crossover junction endodeoxyribonuclease RuvC [Hyphomonadaceae bacterium]
MYYQLRILGIDPSLVACGWGVVDMTGTKLTYIAHGVIRPDAKTGLPLRLREIFESITDVIRKFDPHETAIEEVFMKNNAASALKLGQARAACILASSLAGLTTGEYSPRSVKKSVVGTGTADKTQVAHMIGVLMPGCGVKAGDAADALAIAVCHANRANAAGALYRKSA